MALLFFEPVPRVERFAQTYDLVGNRVFGVGTRPAPLRHEQHDIHIIYVRVVATGENNRGYGTEMSDLQLVWESTEGSIARNVSAQDGDQRIARHRHVPLVEYFGLRCHGCRLCMGGTNWQAGHPRVSM